MKITHWRTAAGKVVEISGLEDEHLCDCVRNQRQLLCNFMAEVKKKPPAQQRLWHTMTHILRMFDAQEALAREVGRRGLQVDHEIKVTRPVGEAVIGYLEYEGPKPARARRSINM